MTCNFTRIICLLIGLNLSFLLSADEQVRQHNVKLVNDFISSIPATVASFSDKEIKKALLIEELSPLLKKFKESPVKLKESDIAKLKETAKSCLDDIIEREILSAVAEREGFSATDEEIDKELAKIASAIQGGLKTISDETGLTEKSLKRRALQGIRIEKWKKEKLIPSSKPDEEQVKKFYEENPELFIIPPKYKISQIFLKNSPNVSEKEILNKIQNIAKDSIREQKFRENAKKFSEDEVSKENGGYLGEFYEDELPPQLHDEVVKLRKGQISKPIKSSRGYHIVRLDSKEDGRTVPLSEAKPRIVEFLTDMNSRLNLGKIIREEREKRNCQIFLK